jgi:hypothetical protein
MILSHLIFRIKNTCFHRSWMVGMVLLAILVQGFMPLGYMPSVDRAGYFTIEICTTEGIEFVSIEPATGDNQSHQTQDHSVCPYVSAYADVTDIFYYNFSSILKPQSHEIAYAYVRSRAAVRAHASRAPPYFS